MPDSDLRTPCKGVLEGISRALIGALFGASAGMLGGMLGDAIDDAITGAWPVRLVDELSLYGFWDCPLNAFVSLTMFGGLFGGAMARVFGGRSSGILGGGVLGAALGELASHLSPATIVRISVKFSIVLPAWFSLAYLGACLGAISGAGAVNLFQRVQRRRSRVPLS